MQSELEAIFGIVSFCFGFLSFLVVLFCFEMLVLLCWILYLTNRDNPGNQSSRRNWRNSQRHSVA